MGQIINVTGGENERPEPLLNRESSGFQSDEYLEDGAAIDAVESDETVQFVVTNHKQGLVIRSDTTRHVMPDNRYRTVVVITDRRVIALVGMEDGDEQFTLDVSRITDVTTTTRRRTGTLTIERVEGPTWEIPTGDTGLDEVADYLRTESDACQNIGRVRATTQSIRGLFESTVDTAKSLEPDRVTEVRPASDEPSSDADTGTTGEVSSTTQSSTESDGQFDQLDSEAVTDAVLQSLATTDWRARSAPPECPFDMFAERTDERMGVVVHCPEDGTIGESVLDRCDAIAGAAGTDTVMLATTGTVRGPDARLAAELGVRLRNVETLCDGAAPPTIEAVTEMVRKVLVKHGWSVRAETSGPFDMLADCRDELMGVVVHNPEDGTVRDSIEFCETVSGAAGTDTVMLATPGSVPDADEELADRLGVRLVESDWLSRRYVTEIAQN